MRSSAETLDLPTIGRDVVHVSPFRFRILEPGLAKDNAIDWAMRRFGNPAQTPEVLEEYRDAFLRVGQTKTRIRIEPRMTRGAKRSSKVSF